MTSGHMQCRFAVANSWCMRVRTFCTGERLHPPCCRSGLQAPHAAVPQQYTVKSLRTLLFFFFFHTGIRFIGLGRAGGGRGEEGGPSGKEIVPLVMSRLARTFEGLHLRFCCCCRCCCLLALLCCVKTSAVRTAVRSPSWGCCYYACDI